MIDLDIKYVIQLGNLIYFLCYELILNKSCSNGVRNLHQIHLISFNFLCHIPDTFYH